MPWQMAFSCVLFNRWSSLCWWRKQGLLISVLFCLGLSWSNAIFSFTICSCRWALCPPVFSELRPLFSRDVQPLPWGLRLCCCWGVCFGPAFLIRLPGRQSAVPRENVNRRKRLWPPVWGAAVQRCSTSRCHHGPRRLNRWS